MMWLLIALTLVVVGLALTYVGFFCSQKFIRPKRSEPLVTPQAVGLADVLEVSFETADGVTLAAWYAPPRQEGKTLIFVHGLGGNRGACLLQAAYVQKLGYGVLLLDMRNHGTSGGNITSLAYHETEDVKAAYSFLKAQPEVNPAGIGLVGHSMGAAVALRAAAELPELSALIVQCGFASLAENVQAALRIKVGRMAPLFAPIIQLAFRLRTGVSVADVKPIDTLKDLELPILFIHGACDRLISVSNTERMYEAYSGTKELHILKKGSHRSLLGRHFRKFAPVLKVFLETHMSEDRQVNEEFKPIPVSQFAYQNHRGSLRA